MKTGGAQLRSYIHPIMIKYMNNNKQQTAVEWLDEHLDMLIPFINQETADAYNSLIERAKQMEKDQITGAWEDGFENGYNDGKYDDEPYYNNSELYYNMTYTDIKI